MGWRDDEFKRQYAACDAWLAEQADELLADDREAELLAAGDGRLALALDNLRFKHRKRDFYSAEESERLDAGREIKTAKDGLRPGESLPHPLGNDRNLFGDVQRVAQPIRRPRRGLPSAAAADRGEQAAPLFETINGEHDDDDATK